jgi:hypothetical protein
LLRVAWRCFGDSRGFSADSAADDATDLERPPEPLDRVPEELGELVEE